MRSRSACQYPSMRQACLFALTFLASTSGILSQSDVPTFKTEARSAFVWGEDNPGGALSSTIRDPLTGSDILRLSRVGIEVSSRIGFEKVSASEVGEFLGYTTTIVNDTDSTITVRYGGVSIDGHLASPLSIVYSDKKLNKSKLKSSKEMVRLERLRCFTNAFLSSDNFFSANASSQAFPVQPRTSLTVSSVIRDPRNRSILCSRDGCYPTGTIRYNVRVNSQDYVFVWPGRSAVYCGG